MVTTKSVSIIKNTSVFAHNFLPYLSPNCQMEMFSFVNIRPVQAEEFSSDLNSDIGVFSEPDLVQEFSCGTHADSCDSCFQ